ncbi:hypothetical protein [Rickettsiella endosymbiont of Miltochrista miniata]|uniref:hypothetical protein n=1 Tax=Rickettsiella endosymbiont of Miltochrista miniata TaxID=3066239 RepID=UPI00313C69BA
MKTYRIKSQFAYFLMGLQGLYITPSECIHYMNVKVFDHQVVLNDLCARHGLTSLPKNCDGELVTAIFEQIQLGKATVASVKMLSEYLRCAEKKDKNNEIKSDIKSDIKASLKEIFLGLLLIVGGGVGGLALMVVLMGLFPAVASWIALLSIPTMAAAVCGIITAVIGCLKLGIGIFSFCFREKNTEELPVLENALKNSFFQPPLYDEVKENYTTYPTAPVLYSELPNYQQAIKNIAAPSTRIVTPSMDIPALVLPQHSPHFFHHHPPHSVASNSAMNANLPPAYSHRCQ